MLRFVDLVRVRDAHPVSGKGARSETLGRGPGTYFSLGRVFGVVGACREGAVAEFVAGGVFGAAVVFLCEACFCQAH